MEFKHQLTGFELECKITSYLNICVIYMLSVFYLCTYINNTYMYTHIYVFYQTVSILKAFLLMVYMYGYPRRDLFHPSLTCNTAYGKSTRHTANNTSPCSIPISIIPTINFIVREDITHDDTA